MRTSSSLKPIWNVRTSTRHVVTFFSFVRIIVLPLPGFTCWKSMQSHIPLSIRMQVPILISCELIIFVYLFLILTFYSCKYTLL